MNTWIGASFKYDLDRAVALSESQRRAKPGPQIVEPEVFFAEPTGVCVDLSRFAVETMKHVAPQLRPRYLMIEFNPAAVRGQILRRHWVVVYEDTDGVRVFADSKRPGVIAGPYHSLNEFIVEYAKFRGREILSYRELESYKRKAKVQSKRLKGDA